MHTNSLLKAIGMYKQSRDPDDPKAMSPHAGGESARKNLAPTQTPFVPAVDYRNATINGQRYGPEGKPIASGVGMTPQQHQQLTQKSDDRLDFASQMGGSVLDSAVGLGAGVTGDFVSYLQNAAGYLHGRAGQEDAARYYHNLASSVREGAQAGYNDIGPQRYTFSNGEYTAKPSHFSQWQEKTSPTDEVNTRAQASRDATRELIKYAPIALGVGGGFGQAAGRFGGGIDVAGAGYDYYQGLEKGEARQEANRVAREQWHQNNTSFDPAFGKLSPPEQRNYAISQVLEAQSDIENYLAYDKRHAPTNNPEEQSISELIAESDRKIVVNAGFLAPSQAEFNALPERVQKVITDAYIRHQQRPPKPPPPPLNKQSGYDDIINLGRKIPGWLKKLTGGVDDAASAGSRYAGPGVPRVNAAENMPQVTARSFPHPADYAGKLSSADLQGILDGTPFRYTADRAELARMIAKRKLDEVPYANLAPPQTTARTVPGGGAPLDYLKTPDVNPYRAPSYIDPTLSQDYARREAWANKMVDRLEYGAGMAAGAGAVGGAAYMYAAPLLEERRQNIQRSNNPDTVREQSPLRPPGPRVENYRQSEKQYFDLDHPGMSTPSGTGSSRAEELEKGGADYKLPEATPTTAPNPNVAPAVSVPISVDTPGNKIPNKYIPHKNVTGPLAGIFEILPPDFKNWYDNLNPQYRGMINQGFSQFMQNMQGNPALPASDLAPTAIAGAQNAKPEFEPTVASAARYAGNIYR